MGNGVNDISTFVGQKSIARWSTMAAVGISAITFMLGKTEVAVGILFSCSLMVLNYWALSLVPRIHQRFRSPHWANVAAFTYYYMRFWLIVLILFLTIPKGGYNFGLGCFIGFIIPKIAMGAIVIANSSEDWWLKRKAPVETNLGHEKRNLTPLEKELLQTNPFEFDIVDFEWKRHLKKP